MLRFSSTNIYRSFSLELLKGKWSCKAIECTRFKIAITEKSWEQPASGSTWISLRKRIEDGFPPQGSSEWIWLENSGAGSSLEEFLFTWLPSSIWSATGDKVKRCDSSSACNWSWQSCFFFFFSDSIGKAIACSPLDSLGICRNLQCRPWQAPRAGWGKWHLWWGRSTVMLTAVLCICLFTDVYEWPYQQNQNELHVWQGSATMSML